MLGILLPIQTAEGQEGDDKAVGVDSGSSAKDESAATDAIPLAMLVRIKQMSVWANLPWLVNCKPFMMIWCQETQM